MNSIAKVNETAVVQSSDGKVFQFPGADLAGQFERSVKEAGGETRRLVPRKSLFELEYDLEALAESIDTVEPDQREEFIADFTAALQATKEKRDRVHRWMCSLEAGIVVEEQEKKRMDKRIARWRATLDFFEARLTRIIKDRGLDKGKWQKLEGEHVTFKLAKTPPTVAIADEAAVPTKFKTVTLTLPAPLWEEVLDSMDLDLRPQVLAAVQKPNSAVLKSLVKDAITDAVPDWKDRLEEFPSVFCDSVPGASIAAGGTRLVRE